MLHDLIANFSRMACSVTGGPSGKTLCLRAAMRWGDDCLFCRLVGQVMGEPHHCADELSARDIYERAKGSRK